MRVLLVDDEKLARDRLRRLLKAVSMQIDVVAEAASAEEASALIEKHHPDLIFLDIQMPGESGLEMMAGMEAPPAVIFVTAHDAFAVKAFEINAVDYLLKPVHAQRLEAALQRVDRNDSTTRLRQLLQSLRLPNNNYLQRLSVRRTDRILFLNVPDILYFKAEDKYTFAVTAEGEEIVDSTLTHLEESLDPQRVLPNTSRSDCQTGSP